MRITIVALNAFPLIEPGTGRNIGGLETFAWNLAQGLAGNEFDQIQFLVRSEYACNSRKHQGVQVDFIHEPCREIRQRVSKAIEIDSARKMPKIKALKLGLLWKIPLLAFRKVFFPRYSEAKSMAVAVERFDPDAIVTLGVNQTSTILGELARDRNIPIALWLQSNADLNRNLFEKVGFVDRYGVRSEHAQACLRLCRNIVCQTTTQFHRLNEMECVQSDSQTQPVRANHIPNPIDTSVFRSAETSPDHRHGVLWIGRADRFHKRPHLALEIAARCTDIPFTMILNPSEDAVYREMLDARPPNVAIVDFVPASEMSKRMSSAWLFLSTGSADYEGFPNVFLEASASGTPIVSLEDFDEFLARSGGGLSGGGRIDQVVEYILRLHTSPTVWMQLSRNSRTYVCEHHDRTAVVQKFRKWLESLVSPNGLETTVSKGRAQHRPG